MSNILMVAGFLMLRAAIDDGPPPEKVGRSLMFMLSAAFVIDVIRWVEWFAGPTRKDREGK